MHKFTGFTVGLVLMIVALAPGCALTMPVQKRVEGYSRVVTGPDGSHEETHKPQPAYIPLLFITVPMDVATFPLQLPFVGCIWSFYDFQFCDAGEHESPAISHLA